MKIKHHTSKTDHPPPSLVSGSTTSTASEEYAGKMSFPVMLN